MASLQALLTTPSALNLRLTCLRSIYDPPTPSAKVAVVLVAAEGCLSSGGVG